MRHWSWKVITYSTQIRSLLNENNINNTNVPWKFLTECALWWSDFGGLSNVTGLMWPLKSDRAWASAWWCNVVFGEMAQSISQCSTCTNQSEDIVIHEAMTICSRGKTSCTQRPVTTEFEHPACGVECTSHAVADRWCFIWGPDFADGNKVVSNKANNTQLWKLKVNC